MSIKVKLNYALLFLICVGLAACNDNDVGKKLTYADIAISFSGDLSGSINAGESSASGTISVNNPDGSAASFVPQTDVAQTYGSFSLSSDGQWTYSLDSSASSFQALNGGETVTEVISFVTAGGSTNNITVTITGVNDPAVLGGVDSGTTTSNSNMDVTGALTLTGDVDSVPDSFVAQSDAASTYGTFSITEDGDWTYTLDTNNSEVQALTPVSDPLTDVIPVNTADGLMTNVTITIEGPEVNTPATFSGDTTGSIDSGDTNVLTGTVVVTDPDTGEATTVAQTSTTLMYGSFSIGTDGVWTYLLDNSNAEVQALTVGSTLTEDAAIASADGTAGAVTITINGTAAGLTNQVIINDSFADGDRTSTGALDADWWSSSSTSGNSVEISAGALGLVSGSSGRGMHATFAPQTLAEGESITVTYSFTTPATIGTAKGTAFKIALMDFNNAGLAADLSSSSSTPNPLYVGLPGYFTAFDVDSVGGGAEDTDIRKHDTASDLGRFLGTTSEWNPVGSSSADAGYAFTANTDYVGVYTITRTGADSVDISSSLSQGGTLLDSHTVSDTSAIANNFGMLGFWANSNTFGSTTASDPDNGLTFTNVLIERTLAAPTNQVIINDSFADGDRTSTGALDADWWSSSSTSGNSVEISAGALGLVSGSSGRGMHATFAPQTLAEGESITVTYSFTTPATIGTAKGTAFKIALMDFNNAGLAADLSSSSSTPNPLYVGLPGYFTAFDVDSVGGGAEDTDIRKHDTASDLGRFLGTTSEWNPVGSSSADAGYAFTANTDYVGVYTITRTGADSVDISSSLSQGGTLLDSHTVSDTSAIANNFGMLGFWANSNTFGSTTASDPDNGLTFTNVLIEKQ